jgi:hypothetical protein
VDSFSAGSADSLSANGLPREGGTGLPVAAPDVPAVPAADVLGDVQKNLDAEDAAENTVKGAAKVTKVPALPHLATKPHRAR